ncbi:8930_t:CDS:1, partial [Cetraspora pellucida]
KHIKSRFYDRCQKSALMLLSEGNIRLKTWLYKWKPFLLAWKRLQGKVPISAGNWPWTLDAIKIMNANGSDFTVTKVLEYLRQSSIKQTLSQANIFSDNQNKENWSWSKIKEVPNKKKDIFWRMIHNALPIGKRLSHFAPTHDIMCPWCPEKEQDLSHFTIECRISKNLWKTVYDFFNIPQEELPTTLENIITANNVRPPQHHYFITWLHINIIFEIWFWLVNAKWGGNKLTEAALPFILKDRLIKELKVLQKTNSNVQIHTINTQCINLI